MRVDKIAQEIESKFGNRLRTRVNGVLIQNEKILMVRHLMSENRIFWSVPGGGMDFGSDAHDNLRREFLEETGLDIEVGEFLCVHEFLKPPLHAIELFFEVKELGGKLRLGTDPELANEDQILSEIRWMSLKDLKKIPESSIHQVFKGIKSMEDIGLWKGYFNFGNKYLK